MCINTLWEEVKKIQSPLDGIQWKKRQHAQMIKRGNPTFTVRVVKHWTRLPTEVPASPSLKIFKTFLGQAVTICSGWPCLSGALDWMISRGPVDCQWFYAPSLYWPLWLYKLLVQNLTTYILNKWIMCNCLHLFTTTVLIYIGSGWNIGHLSFFRIFFFFFPYHPQNCWSFILIADQKIRRIYQAENSDHHVIQKERLNTEISGALWN